MKLAIKILFIFASLHACLYADFAYKKGWNLLGGAVSLDNIGDEEIWVFDNNQWILKPNKIDKHQGFWYNAYADGTWVTFDHDFEYYLPSIYTLYSLVIQYIDQNEEIAFSQTETKNSYLNIKKDLSYEEYLLIESADNAPIKASFFGNFLPIVHSTSQIVEYDQASKLSLVISVNVTDKILVLTRYSNIAGEGEVHKKYTYLRQ